MSTRYLIKAQLANGTEYYRYNPPSKYIEGGIVTRCNLGECFGTATQKAKQFNVKIDEFDAKQKELDEAMKIDCVWTLVQKYYKSHDFIKLNPETRRQYRYFLDVMLNTSVIYPEFISQSQMFKNIGLSKVTMGMARQAYNEWCGRGIQFANHVVSCSRIVYYYGMNMEYCERNPFANIKKHAVETRKVVWSKDMVKTLLDEAYSDFKYRNIGLIAHMAYEWCQRVGDMRVLTWSSIDFDAQRVNIEQSKRRAEVFLPIEDELFEMLQVQYKDFGFQDYVAPNPVVRGGVYTPYSQFKLPKHARALMNLANLPTELCLSDLRRTGTIEMVDAGVPMGQIMSVTGHANPQSVKPYMKNTFNSASNALKLRKENV